MQRNNTVCRNILILNVLLFLLYQNVHADQISPAILSIDFNTNKIQRLYHWEYKIDTVYQNDQILEIDSLWKPVYTKNKRDVSKLKGKTFWLRKQVQLKNVPAKIPILLSFYYVSCALEIYWDGQLISTNGKVGKTKSNEKPGIILHQSWIPKELATNGNHLISLHISSHCYPVKIGYIEIGITNAIHEAELKSYNSNMFITTFLVTMSLVNLLLFFGFNYNVSYLFLSIYCILHSMKVIFRPVWFFQHKDFLSIQFNEILLHYIVIAGGMSLIIFLLYKFSYRRKYLWTISILILTLISYFIISKQGAFPVIVAGAFVIGFHAAYRKLEGSTLILLGLIGLSIGSYLGFLGILNIGYFAGIMFFIACMTISVGRQLARQNKKHHEMILRTSRLENQLLKKNIQPHFIMNSLTSIQELIDTDPRKAIQFINALADEFHMFSKLAGKTLVPLNDELELCKAHLKIMEFRKNSKFHFQVNQLSGDEMIPPCIFHTIIENGLTHGYANKQHGCFSLTKETIPNGIRYTLHNDGDHPSCEYSNNKGTGFRYIEARLEESFPGNWKFECEPNETGWNVYIEIYSKNRNFKYH